jgi:hypothetical protein
LKPKNHPVDFFPETKLLNKKVKMRSLLLLFIIACLASCTRNHQEFKDCSLNSVDYTIYSRVLGSLLVTGNGSSQSTDSSVSRFIAVSDPKSKLLLIDSTRSFSGDDLIKLQNFMTDSILFANFRKQNLTKCSIDTTLGVGIRFRKFPRTRFDELLKLNLNNGFMEIYKKYPAVSGIVEFSKIGYNPDWSKALVEICYYQSPEYSFGVFYQLELIKGEWLIKDKMTDW